MVKLENPDVVLRIKEKSTPIAPEDRPKAGDQRVFIYTGLTMIPQVVEPFSENLPSGRYHPEKNPNGIIGRDYDDLSVEQKAIVDKTVPDVIGTEPNTFSREKFQKEIYLHFKDRETGWKYDWDIRFWMRENGKPKAQLLDFLKQFGPVTDGVSISGLIKIGAMFTGTLVARPGDTRLHIDPKTLAPYFEPGE